MKRKRSIQFRLTAWYALMLVLALCLFSGMIWLSLRQRLISDTERELKGSASRFEAYFKREAGLESGAHLKGELEEFCQALPDSSYLQLQGSDGFEFHFPQRRRNGGRNLLTVHSGFVARGSSFTLDSGTSMRNIHHTLELLWWLLLSLIPAVIVIACFGGAWLSRRALRPVDEITGAARTIGIENLSQRLPVPQTGDELERLTDVWNTMLERLESAVTTLSQFAADASHELRTPLAVIRTSAELALRRARSTESYKESLEEIESEAARMTQLVEDLLFLARSDARSAGMPMAPVDLGLTLRDVATELRDLAELKGIKMHCSYPDSELIVSGNAMALRRLFLVLLDNSIRYSHRGGDVRVTLSASDDRVTVLVQDSGVGIAAKDLPHIFKRFYRADEARSDGGHGLGLSLAATIAQAHGAVIEVASAQGEGATFSVTFPLRSALISPGPRALAITG